MRNNTAIRVEGLSKAYRIGLKERRHDTVLGAVTAALRSPLENYRALRKLSRFDDIAEAPSDMIWALRDVSFEVNHGEVLGIIGSNGAGKSTLLKVLSRITEPTSGRAEIHGRVGSLLEVGTGFHPDLTGRENVYLNGTILGMKKREIDARFDEIVDFSGVAKFIDTPVKRFSSGMRVRLAFAVAAHLDPEILIIDEVLAVGDVNFQKRCLGKMNEVAAQGRTVLFVSHNLGFVKELCQTGLLLSGGQVSYRGSVLDAITRYSGLLESTEGSAAGHRSNWIDLRLLDQAGSETSRFDNSQPITIEATLQVNQNIEAITPICLIDGPDGTALVHHSPEPSDATSFLPRGHVRVRVTLPPLWLAPDAYSIHLKVMGTSEEGLLIREVSPRLLLDITDGRHTSQRTSRARLTPPAEWSVERCP